MLHIRSVNMGDLTASKYTCMAKVGDTQILHSHNFKDRDKHCLCRRGTAGPLSFQCHYLQYFPLSSPLAKKEIVYN